MFKISKRKSISNKELILIQVAVIVLALLVSSIFIMMTDNNPISVYGGMIKGAFGSAYRIKRTLRVSIPLVIISMGIIIAFKMKFWNIGAEGQYIMGAFAGTFFALKYHHLPKPLLLIIMLTAGFLMGGLWGFIPAYFKAKYKTNETIFTLLMNYIAIKWITYLQFGPWKDPNALGFAKIASFKQSAVLPKLFGIHIGWIIALLIVVFTYLYIKHTKHGYELSVIGESENTAKYAGMKVGKVILRTIFISAGFAGLAGIIETSAVSKTLAVSSISTGVGYTAIITAWLSNLNAFICLAVSILFSAMVQGGSVIQSQFGIPSSVAFILQGTILFFILGSGFFIKYKIKKS